MSTITVTNIKATGETASRAVSGVAAAWAISVNNSSTFVLRDSTNIASITDEADGQTTFNLTNNMGSSNYSVCYGTGGTSTQRDRIQVERGDVRSAGSYRLDSFDTGAASTVGVDGQHSAIFGDLA
jgi:hypothetical protein